MNDEIKNTGLDKSMITAPEISKIVGFLVTGNYYFSLLIKNSQTQICFPVCSQNTLFCFKFQNLIRESDLKRKGWIGNNVVVDSTQLLVPPDRSGLYLKKKDLIVPTEAEAFSKIFWNMPHTVNTMKTSWSEYPVLFSNVGSTYPSISFVRAGEWYFIGIGDTPDRAVLNAVHLARLGTERLSSETDMFMDKFEGVKNNKILMDNILLALFYSNSRCIDQEDNCILASKSPEYYVSTGFWARDFVHWTLPIIEMFDVDRVKLLLEVLFKKYWKNKGIHALYIDGRVLYNGFELDQIAAYLVAVEKGLKYGVLKPEEAKDKVLEIIKILKNYKNKSYNLYSTELNTSDDPVIYPYVTYNNVLLWYSFNKLNEPLSRYFPDMALSEFAERIKKDVLKKMVVNERFCYSTDLDKNYIFYDDPTGSLLLLPFLGFVDKNSKIYKNTVTWIKSTDNEYFVRGEISGLGNMHVKHPWVHYYSSLLLSSNADGEMVLNLLLDDGLACETVNENTRKCLTGIHFPGSSGFLAMAILNYK